MDGCRGGRRRWPSIGGRLSCTFEVIVIFLPLVVSRLKNHAFKLAWFYLHPSTSAASILHNEKLLILASSQMFQRLSNQFKEAGRGCCCCRNSCDTVRVYKNSLDSVSCELSGTARRASPGLAVFHHHHATVAHTARRSFLVRTSAVEADDSLALHTTLPPPIDFSASVTKAHSDLLVLAGVHSLCWTPKSSYSCCGVFRKVNAT